MARVFITGSSTGLGLMAGQLLIQQGHQVVMHARDSARASDLRAAAQGAEAIITGDLSTLAGMTSVAEEADRLGTFDAVIHNAGIGYREPRRIETVDGLPHVFAVNVLAPYVLTALIARPKRLVYVSSGMHHGTKPNLDDLFWTRRPWQGAQAYAESKLYDVILAFAVARLWPKVHANALEPGWVPTRMGGVGAPDDISKAHLTQAWLAVSTAPLALSTGAYFFHQRLRSANPIAENEAVQTELLDACARASGVALPAS